jgi:hypothetical protein
MVGTPAPPAEEVVAQFGNKGENGHRCRAEGWGCGCLSHFENLTNGTCSKLISNKQAKLILHRTVACSETINATQYSFSALIRQLGKGSTGGSAKPYGDGKPILRRDAWAICCAAASVFRRSFV